MASFWSAESNPNMAHRMLRGLQDVEDTVTEANLVADLNSQDDVASKMSIFAKISVGIGFMALLFVVLGTFHWYFNKKYSDETENAISNYVEARSNSMTARMETAEDAALIKRRLRLIREVGKHKFYVKEKDILTEDDVMALNSTSPKMMNKKGSEKDLDQGQGETTGNESGSCSSSSQSSSPPRKSPLMTATDEFHDIFDSNSLSGLESDAGGAEETYLRLPDKRIVRNCCSICIAPYGKGDQLVCSSNTKCPHVYHFDCILRWLCQRDANLCPMCRQSYVKMSDSNGGAKKAQGSDNPEDMFSFNLEEGEDDALRRRVSFVATDADTAWADDHSRAGHYTNSMRSELTAYISERSSGTVPIEEEHEENGDSGAATIAQNPKRRFSLPIHLHDPDEFPKRKSTDAVQKSPLSLDHLREAQLCPVPLADGTLARHNSAPHLSPDGCCLGQHESSPEPLR